MKRILIAGLVCVNLALLGALLSDSATGQAPGARPADYVLFTGKIAPDHDAVYLIDIPGSQMAAWRFDPQTRRLRPYRTRSLQGDFLRPGPTAPAAQP